MMQDQAELLTATGWEKTDVTFRRVGGSGLGAGREQITWWKKNGHEYPQHLAVWLERLQHPEAPQATTRPHKSVGAKYRTASSDGGFP